MYVVILNTLRTQRLNAGNGCTEVGEGGSIVFFTNFVCLNRGLATDIGISGVIHLNKYF